MVGRTVISSSAYKRTAGFDRDAKESFDPMFQSKRIARAFGTNPPAEPKQIIEFMMGRPLDFDPGSREAYSNFGYCVLGRIIEKLSGTPVYTTYVEKAVLEPLGIHRMRLGRTLEKDRAPGDTAQHLRKRRSDGRRDCDPDDFL